MNKPKEPDKEFVIKNSLTAQRFLLVLNFVLAGYWFAVLVTGGSAWWFLLVALSIYGIFAHFKRMNELSEQETLK